MSTITEAPTQVMTSYAPSEEGLAPKPLEAAPLADEVHKTAYNDVKELANGIQTVKIRLEDVSTHIKPFDDGNFKSRDGPVLQLGNTWDQHKASFVSIISKSRGESIDAVSVMNQISPIFVVGCPVDQFKKIASNVLDKLKSKTVDPQNAESDLQDSSLALKTALHRLADDIQLFTNVVNVKIQEADEVLQADINESQRKIDDLRRKHEDLDDQIAAAASQIISTVADSFFSFASDIASAVSGDNDNDVSNFLEQTRAEKDRVFAELTRANDDHSALEANQRALQQMQQLQSLKEDLINAITSDVQDIAQKTEIFSNIWQTITLDVLSLSDGLEAGMNTTTRFFQRKILPTKERHAHLTECLQTYVNECQAI